MNQQDLVPVERKPLAVAQSGNDMLLVLERALTNPNVDVEKAERMMALMERALKMQAEAAFNDALAFAQKEMPKIQKDARNQSTNSTYATLEKVNEAIVPIYTKHNLSLSFGSGDCPIPDHVRIVCDVSHKDPSAKFGHTRRYQCDVPLDTHGAKGTPNKTKTHGFGSTLSYGRRYLSLLIFNIALTDDDDGNQGQKSKPQGPRRATEATKQWFLNQTKDLWPVLAEYAGDQGWIPVGGSVDEIPLEYVPTTQQELLKLKGILEGL